MSGAGDATAEAGWRVFPAEPATRDWVASARGPAREVARDPAMRARWLRHEGTWFVGVDALANDGAGRVAGGPPLSGAAIAAALGAAEAAAGTPAWAAGGTGPLHRGQVSVVLPGYPGRDPGESDAAHRFRRARDAAHLDGLLPEGPERRRHLREPHAFLLGIALEEADPGAAPLVVREGSHRVIRAAFARAFAGRAPGTWGDIDLTGTYRAARAEVLATCRRVALPLRPGEAVLVHRMAIHGVAPWAPGARAGEAGRVIVYFRPLFADPAAWMARD